MTDLVEETKEQRTSKTVSRSGAYLVRHALEQIGVRYTFGIPGVHNTEIYDELSHSDSIEPILVTHEGGGSFMADAISRTTNSIGTCLIVPAAGVTHAASGIAEASLDGIPMLVISGGIRNDTGRAYQLHDMDQHALLAPITKATFKVEKHADIVETIYKAYDIATSGEPGPVFVEIPTNVSMFRGEASAPKLYSEYAQQAQRQKLDKEQHSQRAPLNPTQIQAIQEAAKRLASAKRPGLFVGWGAANAVEQSKAIAELLNAPVCTTLQGLSAFPANHPLHTGMGFGAYAVPAAENAFSNCDCLLAVGTRFSEIPTGSFSMPVPNELIHIDINPQVFNQNYPATVSIEGDAMACLSVLEAELRKYHLEAPSPALREQIAQAKKDYQTQWRKHDSKDRVNPAAFFSALRDKLEDDAFVVADDGNHTFLTAELMPIYQSKHFICPSDFNCMGYCVPASIACKLAHPQQQVVGIVGDGAFMMTALELITAKAQGLGVVMFVFNDGELSQISQAQNIPYNRKTCSVLGGINVKGVADAVGAEYLSMRDNDAVDAVLEQALQHSQQETPVIVDVNIDYSKRTRFTEGVVSANLKRFPLKEKVRFISRALVRKITH